MIPASTWLLPNHNVTCIARYVKTCYALCIVVHLLIRAPKNARMPLERHSLSTNKILLDLALLEDKKQQSARVTAPL